MIESHEIKAFLIDADTDERAAYYYGPDWRAVDTMPESGSIECLTVTGLIRRVNPARPRDPIRQSCEKGPRRQYVYAESGSAKIGAIAWRFPIKPTVDDDIIPDGWRPSSKLTLLTKNFPLDSENENRAYREGISARKAGRQLDSNPYDLFSDKSVLLHTNWSDGWHDGLV